MLTKNAIKGMIMINILFKPRVYKFGRKRTEAKIISLQEKKLSKIYFK